MDFHTWVDVALGLGSIASTIGGVYMAFRLSRSGDRDDTVVENERRIAHIEGFLSARFGYRVAD